MKNPEFFAQGFLFRKYLNKNYSINLPSNKSITIFTPSE